MIFDKLKDSSKRKGKETKHRNKAAAIRIQKKDFFKIRLFESVVFNDENYHRTLPPSLLVLQILQILVFV